MRGEMGSISSCSSSLFSIIFIFLCLFNNVAGDDSGIETKREALEIIIGGGSGPAPVTTNCPPPPSPPPPPPPPSPPPPSPPPPSPPPPSPPPPSPPPPSPPPPSPPPPSPPPPSPSPPPPSPPPPSPSPPPPSPPPPSPPPIDPLKNLKAAKRVILKFKQQIDITGGGDPKGVTKTWTKSGDVCKFKGFTCDTLPGKGGLRSVAGVKFNGYAFYGFKNKGGLKLQTFLDQLPTLAFFHSNSNNFTGRVPPRIGTNKIKYLYELDLSNNKLQEEFPKEVLEAKNLTFLDLRFNSFHGPIPSGLFNLDVQVIFINNNNFEQQLPYNFGETPAQYLTFAYNKFSGPIPSSIGKARNLIEVLFLNNQLSGCLPYEIGFLKKATLFDASQNQLTGPIPYSFACLEKMELLNFANNQLYGEVPELVCKLPKLQKLTLSNNYLTQVGPQCRKLIDRKVLDVRNNCVLGLPNQKSKAECAHFFSTPKHCPNDKLMSHVPCKKQWYFHLQINESSNGKGEAPAPAPVTYGALVPNGL